MWNVGVCTYVDWCGVSIEARNTEITAMGRETEKGGSVSCVTITLAGELEFCAMELMRQRNLVNAYTFYKLCVVYCCYIV